MLAEKQIKVEMMKLVVFTNNQSKLKEIKEIFLDVDIEVQSYRECLGYDIDVEETGTTFHQNAVLKATALPKDSNRIVIADDSGIEVTCLDGAPGVYSARYAGEGASSESMSKKLLSDVGDAEDRTAQYRCVIAIHFPTQETETVEGVVKGKIAYSKDYNPGPYGFGYDPVFIPEGYTTDFSHIPTEEKHAISHRGQALRKAYLRIEKYLDTV